MTAQMVLSANVDHFLKATGRSRAGLARALGLSPGSVSQKLHNKTTWSFKDIDKLMAFFDVDLDVLFDKTRASYTTAQLLGLETRAAHAAVDASFATTRSAFEDLQSMGRLQDEDEATPPKSVNGRERSLSALYALAA